MNNKIIEEYFKYDNSIIKQNIYVISENELLVTFYYDLISEITSEEENKIYDILSNNNQESKIYLTDLSGIIRIREVEDNEIFKISKGEFIIFRIIK